MRVGVEAGAWARARAEGRGLRVGGARAYDHGAEEEEDKEELL